MAARSKQGDGPEFPRRRATSPEAREQQLVSMAMDLAEQRIVKGTATAPEIIHWLKISSVREKYERENLQLEAELKRARTKQIGDADRNEALLNKALSAFKGYTGDFSDPVELPDED